MDIDTNYITPFLIDQIKETVIQDFNKEYYNQNHDNISYEKEAEVIGITDAVRYLESIGILLVPNDREFVFNSKADFEAKMYDRERVLNGEVTTLDKEFEKVISVHPEALIKYKKLALLYKIDNGRVIAKTNEELIQDLEYITSNTNWDDNTVDMYKNFYMYYLNCSRKF